MPIQDVDHNRRWALLMETVDVIYPSGLSGGGRLLVDVMTYRERRRSSLITGLPLPFSNDDLMMYDFDVDTERKEKKEKFK